MRVAKALGRYLSDMIYFLSREGSWDFYLHEKIALEAAIETLPNHARTLFRSQLKGSVFVQRSLKQIGLPRFYSKNYDLDERFINEENLFHHVINVQYLIEGKKETANVEFYKGRIESVQFKRPPKYYAGKVITVIGVKPGKVGRTHADAIDRLEHGKNP